MPVFDRVHQKYQQRSLLGVLSGFLVAVSLTGCGVPNKPSESDLKSGLSGIFNDCSPVKISDVKVTNGIEVDERHHILNASFTLTATPIEANLKLWKSVMDRKDQLKQQCDSIHQQLEAAESNYKRAYRDKNDYVSDRMSNLGDRSSNIDEDPKYQALFSAFQEADDQKRKILLGSAGLLKDCRTPEEFGNELKTTFQNNFFGNDKACRINTRDFFAVDLMMKTFDKGENYANSTSSQFNSKFNMIKTDNGWKIQGRE